MKFLSFAKEDYVLETVPKEGRRSLSDTLFIWFGFAFFPGGILVSISIAAEFNMSSYLQVLITSGLILGCISAISGTIGQRQGSTFGLITRPLFGYAGMTFPSILSGLSSLGWDSITLATGAIMISTLLNVPYPLVVIVTVCIYVITALGGFNFMRILSYVSVPAIAIIIGIACGIAVKNAGGMEAVAAMERAGTMTKAAGITAIVGTFAHGAGVGSLDIQRFCRSMATSVFSGLLAFLVGLVYLMGVSGIAGLAVGNFTIEGLFGSVNMIIPGAIAVFLLTWTTTDNDYYAVSLAFSNVFKLKRVTTTLIAAGAAMILALLKSYEFLIPWLGIMSTILIPLAGVIAADYFVINRGKYPSVEETVNKETMKKILPSIRYTSYISWIIGAIVVWYYTNAGIGIPPLYGWLAAFISQVVICALYQAVKNSKTLSIYEQDA